MSRREAFRTIALTAGALAVAPSVTKAENVGPHNAGEQGPFYVPELGYPYDALEPYIDAETMQIHHDKHNAAYVENLNKALAEAPQSVRKMSLEELLVDSNNIPGKLRTAIHNNAGGQYNHSLFWKLLKKNNGRKPSAELASAITNSFGSYTAFQDRFTEAATKIFGSGWAWLVTDKDSLKIVTTGNQNSPISKDEGATVPVLGIDIWEHAYYLKYQNRRAEYVKAFWNVINWDYVTERYIDAAKPI